MVCAACAIPSHTKLSRQWPRPTAGIERLNDPVEMILNEAPTGLVSDNLQDFTTEHIMSYDRRGF